MESDATGPRPAFEVGAIVALRVDPSRLGPVTEILAPVGGIHRYVVFLAADSRPTWAEDQLIPASLPDAGAKGAEMVVVSPTEFRNHLTNLRLRHPQSDHLYALRAARIRFIPFQFKPLLRLLRSDRPRILIADEVGVGKTIEAGLILRELQSRQRIDRVLILCPKALVTKWQAEMRRFDEPFRILDGPALRHCLRETHLEGVWPTEYNRAIVHYELARREEHRLGTDDLRHRVYGLEELDPPPSFDLVIADEAHHVRNPGTLGYQFVDYLQRLSEAVVLLSATPVQTGAADLFNLLHLIRSDLFPSFDLFAEQVEPNRHYAAAARALRSPGLSQEERSGQALEALDSAARTRWGARLLEIDPLLQGLHRRLSGLLSDQQRVDAMRDLEEIHTLASVMNRTRRRDIGRFTIREPRSVHLSFTPAQQHLYDEVVRFRAELLLQEHDPFVVNFVLPNIERQAASSINALAASIDLFLEAHGHGNAAITDDPEFSLEDAPLSSIDLTARASRVLEAARSLPLDEDPKIDALNTIVEEAVLATEGSGKVLVFSFFIRTVEYAAESLRQRGRRVGVIHGGVAEHEREELRRRFRLRRHEPESIDVLVSSEVGCEGLDFEFCDRIVNFDLPWNPMKVEQRIGRIDRYGQQADKVFIHNLVTEGTVEDRVWFRCFERLDIFRSTVGDLEEVLGELTEQLDRLAVDPSLTPEQATERAQQLADNAIRLASEHRRVEEGAADLFGVGDLFSADVESAVTEGRFVSGEDLRSVIDEFVSSEDIGGRLVRADDGLWKLRLSEAAQGRLAATLSEGDDESPQSLQLSRRLNDEDLRFTFDDEVAAERRSVEFVTPVHPLSKAAASRPTPGLVSVYAIVSATKGLAPGIYEFTTDLWELISARPDTQLHTVVCDSKGQVVDDEVAQRLIASVGAGQAAAVPDPRLRFQSQLDEAADRSRRERIESLREHNNELVDRRRASQERSFEQRGATIQQYLDDSTNDRITRMRSAQLVRAEREHEERLAVIEASRDADIVATPVARGKVEVV